MAGVVGEYAEKWQARRTIRDDVLESLYGNLSAGAVRLIDEGLRTSVSLAQKFGIEAVHGPMFGLTPGELRTTSAASFSEVVRHASLLYSSLSTMDVTDDPEEDDQIRQEDVGRRFGFEVRSAIAALRPDLKPCLKRRSALVSSGDPVRFGFHSDRVIVHFSVLHPVKQSNSLSTARGKMWELEKAKDFSGANEAALVSAMPRQDDALIGPKQRAGLQRIRDELEREASKAGIRLVPVSTVLDGANMVIELHQG